MSEHPNAQPGASQGFERFVQGDVPALLELFADDAVWHVPGSMALSGAHHGREAIIAFLRGTAELTGGTYGVELRWTVADDDHLVAVYRARRSGRTGVRSTSSRRSSSSSRTAGGRSYAPSRSTRLHSTLFWNDG